ncbi:MAG: class I SAM-dependent RNA methyltransferase [Anaerolineae bacterium]
MTTRLSPSRLTETSPTVTVQLETMIYGGEALGRVDGQAIFVTGGLADETVRVVITERRKNFARGIVTEVLEPSPERVTPRCRHFGFDAEACGGCHWQHIDYAAQLRFKRDIVREQLARLGKIADAPVRDVIASPQPWAYRNHAQFGLTPDGQPGFQAAHSHRVIPIDECHIVRPEILDWLLTHQHIAKPDTARIDIRFPPAAFHVRDAVFQVAPEGFFQVNTSLLDTLVEQVLTKLDLRGGEAVIDAYCGVGLFTRFIAPLADRVVGIESSRSAIEAARQNLTEFKHVQFDVGRVEEILPKLVGRFDAIVVDPPRAGCGQLVIQTVIDRKIDRVVYVSCDPATLARDARQLIESGYRLIEVQPLDMFPQTFHIETVTLFLKSDHAIL